MIKIVWYNVLRGFHKKEEDGSLTFEPKRLEATKKIISKLNPDILFLGEADFNPNCKFKGPKTQIVDYGKIFKYKHVYYSKTDKTSRKGEAIFSKFPFKAKYLSKGENTHIKSIFSINLKKINIDIIHPYPTISEKEKTKWVDKVLSASIKPHILLGDLNALSPNDKYKPRNLFKMFFPMQKDKKLTDKNVKDSLQTLMIRKVLNAGLIDTFKEKNNQQEITFPTKKYSPFKDKSVGIRIDYIFCSDNFKVLESGIDKNKLSEIASDHYPIYANLELE